jgi:hypothetical protein
MPHCCSYSRVQHFTSHTSLHTALAKSSCKFNKAACWFQEEEGDDKRGGEFAHESGQEGAPGAVKVRVVQRRTCPRRWAHIVAWIRLDPPNTWVSGIQDQSCVSAGLVTGWCTLESLAVM